MRITLLLINCISITFAWLLPERCQQNARHARTTNLVQTPVAPSVEEIAANQQSSLIESFKDYQFYGVPVSGTCKLILPEQKYLYVFKIPHNCSFHTYDPRLLSSVACHSAACKLVHTVTTTDSYTASEGYNWGVKITTKFSIPKVFEVGGEASTGGTYSCAYTKGRTTTDTVECSDSSGTHGNLQLYSVKSDMKCNFGTLKMLQTADHEISEAFTQSEKNEIVHCWLFPLCGATFIDTNEISDGLLQKILKEFPRFSPFKDLIGLTSPMLGENVIVVYLTEVERVNEYDKIIPFTNVHGDSVYQYACMITP